LAIDPHERVVIIVRKLGKIADMFIVFDWYDTYICNVKRVSPTRERGAMLTNIALPLLQKIL
jgi:hypothetical protein